MSKKQYSPRKQKREKGKVEGEHSKVPNKTPEINKEGEKAEKGGLDETLTSAWSDWQWVNEGWYYYRARRGENGKPFRTLFSMYTWNIGADRGLTVHQENGNMNLKSPKLQRLRGSRPPLLPR